MGESRQKSQLSAGASTNRPITYQTKIPRIKVSKIGLYPLKILTSKILFPPNFCPQFNFVFSLGCTIQPIDIVVTTLQFLSEEVVTLQKLKILDSKNK